MGELYLEGESRQRDVKGSPKSRVIAEIAVIGKPLKGHEGT